MTVDFLRVPPVYSRSMRERIVVLWGLLLAVALFASACSEAGIGAPCNAGNSTAGNLKVALGTGECTTAVCVSYLGSAGYCSIACKGAVDCPQPGYICCPVVQTGAQTPCTTDAQCTSRQVCNQGVCQPKQFCVQGTGGCQ